MLKKMLENQSDGNSTAVREIVEEVAERVLRNLSPEQPRSYLSPKS